MVNGEEGKNTSAKAKFGFLIIHNHLKFNLAESSVDYQVIAAEKVTPISHQTDGGNYTPMGEPHAHPTASQIQTQCQQKSGA